MRRTILALALAFALCAAAPALAQCPGGTCPYTRPAPPAAAPAIVRPLVAKRPMALSCATPRRGLLARIFGHR